MTKLLDCPICNKKKQPVRDDAKVCCSACRVKQWCKKQKEIDNEKT